MGNRKSGPIPHSPFPIPNGSGYCSRPTCPFLGLDSGYSAASFLVSRWSMGTSYITLAAVREWRFTDAYASRSGCCPLTVKIPSSGYRLGRVSSAAPSWYDSPAFPCRQVLPGRVASNVTSVEHVFTQARTDNGLSVGKRRYATGDYGSNRGWTSFAAG